MVSTDDEEIKLVAESLGALVPFFRSKKASDDRATLMDVLVEVLGRYAEKGIHFNYCCCILATAPFAPSRPARIRARRRLMVNHLAIPLNHRAQSHQAHRIASQGRAGQGWRG